MEDKTALPGLAAAFVYFGLPVPNVLCASLSRRSGPAHHLRSLLRSTMTPLSVVSAAFSPVVVQQVHCAVDDGASHASSCRTSPEEQWRVERHSCADDCSACRRSACRPDDGSALKVYQLCLPMCWCGAPPPQEAAGLFFCVSQNRPLTLSAAWHLLLLFSHPFDWHSPCHDCQLGLERAILHLLGS